MQVDSTQTVDLLISHSQIIVRSREFNEDLSQWGRGNITQGALLHRDYLLFDPIVEGAFGANVILSICHEFKMDPACQRCILAPFCVVDKDQLEVASAAEKFKIYLPLNDELYSVYYEVCEGEEVFYKLTFIPSTHVVTPQYLLADHWGGEKGKKIIAGFAE